MISFLVMSVNEINALLLLPKTFLEYTLKKKKKTWLGICVDIQSP